MQNAHSYSAIHLYTKYLSVRKVFLIDFVSDTNCVDIL